MKFKKSIILLVLAIFIFGMASVCASDVNDTIVASEDTGQMILSAGNEITDDTLQISEKNETLIQSTNYESLAVGTDMEILTADEEGNYSDLRKDIEDGGNLTKSYYRYNDGDGNTIEITTPCIINGNGAIIDMAGSPIMRVFQVNSSGVIIKNLTIKNANYSDAGGAIYFGVSGTVENCNFINNSANFGGAVYFGDGTTANVTDCNFINNSAYNGGAIYFNDEVTNATINSIFTGNTAERTGGAIYIKGKSANNNFTSEFYDNRAITGSGGAISFSNLVENNSFECIFADNYALYGGGIFFYNKANNNKFDSNFTSNVAKSCGGAMFFYNTTNNNSFAGSFINNSALGQISEDGNGGAITFKDTSSNSVFTCDFINNSAAVNGGAVNYRQTPYNITFNSNFINNTSPTGGGVNFFESFENVVFNGEFIANSAITGGAIAAGDGIIENVLFKDNHAEKGGAVYFYSVGKVISCNFTNNSADDCGGAVFFETNCSGYVANCNFINNSANFGGAVYFGDGTTANVTDCNFINNSAYNGGAIYFNDEVTNATINSIFTGNTAERTGGAIYIKGKSANNNFTSEFYDNRAITGSGGAISFSNLVENNSFECIFADNYALYGGGIFFYNKANNNKFDSNFTSNVAKSCGGAMFFYNTTNNNSFAGSFINNSALGQISEDGNGGAITFKDTSSNSVFTCDFINNSAAVNGGAVNYRQTPYNITFNSNFINNTSPTGGGVNFFESFENVVFNGEFIANSAITGGAIAAGDGIIENVLFKDNHAEKGGAVYFYSVGKVISCNFTNNSADDCGGAVFFETNCSGYVANCNFINNTASSDGGAVCFDDAPSGIVIDCNFTGNTASRDGGALNFWNNVNVTNCDFTDNHATGEDSYGGAINMNMGNVENCNFTDNYVTDESGFGGAIYIALGSVGNCNFANNSAYYGGAIYGDSISLTNSNFTDNSVTSNGGALYFSDDCTIDNCIFTGNNATNGSAIYFFRNSYSIAISNSSFLNNRANADTSTPFNVTKNESRIEIIFMGQDNFLNAIYSQGDIKFSNVTYWGAEGITNTDNSTPSRSNREAGQNITVIGVVNGNIINTTKVTDENGTIVLEDIANCWIVVRHDADSYYTEAEEIISQNMTFNVNVTSKTSNNKTVNITAESNIFNEFMPGKLLFILPDSTEINATYGENGTWWAEYTFNEYGEFNVSASYVGLDNVTVSNGTINITRADSTITLDDIVINYGESVNVTVITTGATGITAKIDGNDVEVNNFTIPISGLDIGNYTLTVTTITDDDHNSVNKTVTVTVNDYIIVSATDVTKYYNGNERFVVIVTDSKNNPLDNQSVSISVNGITYNRTTNANGTASIAINLISGEYNVTTVACNITVYSTITVLPTVNATDLVKVFRNATQFYATFKDSQGNYLADGTAVRFNINGVFYDRKISGSEGLAKLNINLEPGQYVITSMNLETGENAANNVTVISRIIENNDLTKYYKNATQYTVKLVDDEGNPVGAGETVTFNINGVFYSRTTNESGIAKLNINLQPGDYVITAEYKNCRVSNNIKVLPVLSASDLTKKYGTDDQFVATLIDGQGNPYAEQRVQFNINGVFYNRVTDSKGQAKLNINLQPGQYIITSSYDGSNIANTVTIYA